MKFLGFNFQFELMRVHSQQCVLNEAVANFVGPDTWYLHDKGQLYLPVREYGSAININATTDQ